MCDPLTITAVGLTAAAGGIGAYNQYQEGVATKNYYDAQAQQAQNEGQLALQQGQKQSELIQDTAKVQGKQLKTSQSQFNASQRAEMAASGLQGGSAEDILNTSFNTQQMDEMALRYNANVKSWETTESAKYKNYALGVQADQYRVAGKNAKRAGKMNAFSTLLGTAGSLAMSGATGAFTKAPSTPGLGTPAGTYKVRI